MSGPIPLPDYSPTYGGDSGPAFSETGDVSVVQGGLNVPSYPNFNTGQTVTPMDSDFAAALGFDPVSYLPQAEDLTLYYYAAAALVALMLIKRKR